MTSQMSCIPPGVPSIRVSKIAAAFSGVNISVQDMKLSGQATGLNTGKVSQYKDCKIENVNIPEYETLRRSTEAEIKLMVGSLEQRDQSTVVNEGTLTKFLHCDIDKIDIKASSDENAAFNDKYRIPLLHKQYVSRQRHEDEIGEWLRQAEPRAMLLVWGPTNTGKTCLAVAAANRAKSVRFEKVIWVKAELCQADDDSELEQVCYENFTHCPELISEGGKVLLVLDNVVDDRIVEKFQDANFVIVTSRSGEIGRDSSFSDNLRCVKVEGLTDEECGRLLRNILKEKEFEELKKESRFSEVLELCHLFDNLPLSVQTIGVRLSADHGFWKKKKKQGFCEYMEEMKEHMEECSAGTADRMGIPAHTRYSRVQK